MEQNLQRIVQNVIANWYMKMVVISVKIVVFQNVDKIMNNENQWIPIAVNPNGIIVTWQEKYGSRREEECIGLWQDSKTGDYMLTWKDDRKIIVKQSNITEIGFSRKE